MIPSFLYKINLNKMKVLIFLFLSAVWAAKYDDYDTKFVYKDHDP